MPDINVRVDEGCAASPFLLWDTLWDNTVGAGDWALADADETLNRGGLRAKAALATAVTLALFTDKACPPDHPLAKFADGDPRGWWGDGIDVRADLGEAPLGSLLWLLERSVVDSDTTRWAESFALDALQPMIAQGAAVQATAVAALLPRRNGITLAVTLIGQAGSKVYDRRFDIVWQQLLAT
jgi:phage gp46-like protein